MNELQIFENPEFGKIRVTTGEDGEPLFVAADVCRALDVQNHKDAIKRLDEDEKLGVVLNDPHGRPQETNCVTEAGLYALVLGSRKPEAKAFKRWVTHEVIPAIRKHGAYLTPAAIEKALLTPDFIIDLATALKKEREWNQALEKEKQALQAENEQQRQAIAEFQPLRQYIDTILSSPGTIATTQIAADYDISAKRLNKILHEEGIQHCVNGQWVLYRKHMGKGYTKSETIPITRSDGREDTKIFTKWTQKGRILIHDIMTRRGIVAVMDRMSAS